MFLPWLIGILFETISPRWTLLAIIMDLILALIVFFWSSTYHKAHQTTN
jgi:uncharacterized membrane protein YqhA